VSDFGSLQQQQLPLRYAIMSHYHHSVSTSAPVSRFVGKQVATVKVASKRIAAAARIDRSIVKTPTTPLSGMICRRQAGIYYDQPNVPNWKYLSCLRPLRRYEQRCKM